MLFDETHHATSVVAITDLTLFEVGREDFVRVLKPHRGDKIAGVFQFLKALPPLAGLSVFELHALAKVAKPQTVGEGQTCLHSHPEPGLPGMYVPALQAYSAGTVYVIRSGEARLMCSIDLAQGESSAKKGQGGDNASPVDSTRRAALHPLVTLGPRELISADLLSGKQDSEAGLRWCLQAAAWSPLNFLTFPRQQWELSIGNVQRARLADLAARRGAPAAMASNHSFLSAPLASL